MKRIRRLFSKIFDFRPACRRAKSDADSRSFGDVNLLFYTCVNEKYFEFALLYPIFVLCSNPGAVVEIGISNMKKFYKKYAHLVDFYKETYPSRVLFSSVSCRGIFPNSVRFVTQPFLKAKYVYIGDCDIMVLEEVLEKHLDNIKRNHLDFSNICRKNTRRLSGLHFIEYDKMFPVGLPAGSCLADDNDEELLYRIMASKGYKIPDEDKCTYRPVHGLHASYYSRPPLPTVTTEDDFVSFPAWYPADREESRKIAEKYLNLRYGRQVREFMSRIREKDVHLRRIVQFMDITADYVSRRFR